MEKWRNIIRTQLNEMDSEPNKPTSNVDIDTFDVSRTVDQNKINLIKKSLSSSHDILNYIFQNLKESEDFMNAIISDLEAGGDGKSEIDKLIEEIKYVQHNAVMMLDGLDYIKRKL